MAQQAMHHSTPGRQSITIKPHFIVELADHAQHALDSTGKAANQIAKSSALRAFRATVTESGSHIPHPVLNASGNLRGMVVSKRARVIYYVSSNVAEKFEKYDRALAFAGIIIEIGKEAHKVHRVIHSNLPTGEKWRRGDLIVSTAILRAVTGVVPDAAHVIAKSLEGYCEIPGLVPRWRAQSERWVGAIRAADAQIKTTHQKLFSPEFIQYLGDSAADAIFAHVHFK
jgi:hypothetical protein